MKEKCYEVCPHCGREVELEGELKVQTCPNCGKRIVPCSVCLACEKSADYCKHCCLSYQAEWENNAKPVISVTQAEHELQMACNRLSVIIEDELYDLASRLFHKCVDRVELEYEIDESNLDSEEKWYDNKSSDIVEQAYEMIYEQIKEQLNK